jgi:hypothetical protein
MRVAARHPVVIPASMAANIGTRTVAGLVLGLLCACGNGSSSPDVQPTPSASPAPSPRPTPGCGNGIIDDGEFCDGEDFCSNCTLAFSDTCCVFAAPDGTSCAESFGASTHACVDSHAIVISVGSSCAGSSCDPATGFCLGDGHCATHPIEPTSICCQLDAGGCKATVVSDTATLADFFFYECGEGDGLGTPVIGSCGDDGTCTRR